MKILITGGAGFIGSSLVRYLASETKHELVVLDKLTYAGNLSSIKGACESPRVEFIQGDIRDSSLLSEIFLKRSPDAVMHLAAESHVDRSIDGPKQFIETNVVGTMELLEAAREYWEQLPSSKRDLFRFHHISTDEVFGDLETSGLLFQEDSPYRPSSPYAASKASADHLVRAWGRTYGLPFLVTNCSNNYGPYQFPEKLIPHMIINALNHHQLPVYGEGQQTRDWLYVDDHVRALLLVLEHGEIGETYNIGGHNEVANIDVVTSICDLLAEVKNENYASLITFVEDRKGHDLRYAIDASKIESDLGWVPVESFQSGLRKTLSWYLSNVEWWTKILDGSYQLGRLGTS